MKRIEDPRTKSRGNDEMDDLVDMLDSLIPAVKVDTGVALHVVTNSSAAMYRDAAAIMYA
jgi:methionine synthase II (cobalamin-independent)